MLKFLVTTGDADGVGWEITVKALNALKPVPGVTFFIYRDQHRFAGPRLNSEFQVQSITRLQDATSLKLSSKSLIVIERGDSPAAWVEEAARACFKKEYHGMITAPLSKTSIIDAGFKDIGHTEILSRVTGRRELFMGFVGTEFNVVLASGHQPLLKAVKGFTPAKLKRALEAAEEMRLILPARLQRQPIGVVGLNPHAGERGLIGKEEKWFRTTLQRSQLHVDGPLVPDSAFLPQNWKRFSVYLTPYHDQGLIPFKMIHGFGGGVHLTLGLPFVRTSVDHGTAKDIFGKNKAQSGSMQDALKFAVKLAKERAQ